MKNIVEICCGSYQDCINAYHGKARRVELNSALSVGGLTPSLSTLRKVKKNTDLKVICMVRPRAAGFCYDTSEIEIMMEDAQVFLENGADGIAFGFLKEDGSIDEENIKKMTELIHSYHKEAVFHRAFDVTADPVKAIEVLIACKVDRVLTSGQKAKAMDGASLIAKLQSMYGDVIEILPGSGMNAANAKEMIQKTGVYQIHSSCKSYQKDPTTTKGSVTYSYLTDEHKNDYDVVSEDLVRKLVEEVER